MQNVQKIYQDFLSFIPNVPALLKDLLLHRLEWKLYPELFLAVICLILAYPAGQLLALMIGIICCAKAKYDRSFFLAAAAILFLLALRETNFGKTIFHPDPTTPNKFLRWEHIPYAPFIDPFLIVYIVLLVIFVFKKQCYKFVGRFLESGKLPACSLLLLIISAASSIIDKCPDNIIFEETAELGLYVVWVGSISHAAFSRKFLFQDAPAQNAPAADPVQ